MEKKVLKSERKLIPSYILEHIQKDFGKITNITKSDIALTNSVFFLDTIKSKKLVLKIFNLKDKALFNISNHKLLLNYFAGKNLTPLCLFFNHKYCFLEYIEGTPLQINNLPVEKFTEIIKEIHSNKLNINKRNFSKTVSIYLKKIPLESLKSKLLQEAILASKKLFEIIDKFDKDYVVCHNDLNINNFIQTEEKLYILDFEYSTINDRYFDLASINNFLGEDNFKIFIEKYGIIINNAKLQAYMRLIEFLSSIWCFRMAEVGNFSQYDYLKEGEYYSSLMISNIKDLY